MLNHDVILNLGSDKVCSPVTLRHDISLITKISGLLQLIIMYYVLLVNCAISIDSYTLINKFYSLVICSLLINAVILLLNCLFLYLSVHT